MKEAMTDGNILGLLFILLLSVISVKFILRNYRVMKAMKKRMAELNKQKCKGPHKWMYMDMGGKSVNVCSDCCWSPTHEGYVKKMFVDAEISHQSFMKDLKEYTDKKLEELGVSQELYDKVINIKKDFTLQHLDEAIKKMTSGE